MRSKHLCWLVIFLICMWCISIPSPSVKAEPKKLIVEITIDSQNAIINGQRDILLDLPAFIVKGRTMVTIRLMIEGFDIETRLENLGKLVIFKNKNTLIEMPINSETVKVNGKEVKIDVPVFIKENRTVVPIRFIMESFGAIVKWEAALSKVMIEYTKPDNL